MEGSLSINTISDDCNNNNNNNNDIQPFEWLTSPASLKPILMEHVLLQDYNNDNVVTQKQQQQQQQQKLGKGCKALHVGCGSSLVGEWLVQEMKYDLVVNMDKDEKTLKRMQQRWWNIIIQEKNNNDCNSSNNDNKLLFLPPFDLLHDELPNSMKYNYFDLIIDKSTLDCTLCSEQATAKLLKLVYQSLKVGGVYYLISFHEMNLLLPLLQNIPLLLNNNNNNNVVVAKWDIKCLTMKRQVEDLITKNYNNNNNKSTTNQNDNNNNNNQHSLLSVLIARKQQQKETIIDLDIQQIIQHVHNVNDDWFQHQHPLMTQSRIEEMKQAFSSSNNNNDIDLMSAFSILFTEAEREHLTFEHFLQDWNAYCDNHPSQNRETISFTTAISFLEEMQ